MVSRAGFGTSALAASAMALLAGALPVAAAPPPISWTGLYIGGQAGALWSRETRDTTAPLTEVFTQSGTGWFGGFQTGYDYQFAPSGLIGIEGAISAASLHQTAPSIVFPPSGYETDVDWLATVTGRLGYISGPWVLYARGGYTATHVAFIGTTPGDYVSVGGVRNGWMLGGGVEYMLKHNFSIALEYAHHDFGTQHYVSQTNGGLPLDANVAFALDSLMLRANLRFGH